MKKALYGLRQSPQHFQEHMAKVLAAEGCLRLKADPQLYYHWVTGAMISIHADDLLITALDVIAVEKALEKHLKVKWGMMVGIKWEKYLGRWMRRRSVEG
eukprot:5926514-Heterocapsa_arctica.AAC.1